MKLILQAVRALFRKIESRLAVLENKLVASDWNAAEGEPGHVLNRTHYIIPEKLILPEMTFVSGIVTGGLALKKPTIELVEGAKYKIFVDGVEYICTAVAANYPADGSMALGNRGLLGGDVSDEPFLLVVFSATTAAQVGASASLVLPESNTNEAAIVSIVALERYKQLDPEFIPELPHPTDILWIDAVTDSLSNPTTVAWKSGPKRSEAKAAIEEGKDVKIRLTAGTEQTAIFTIEKVTVSGIYFQGRIEDDDTPWRQIFFFSDTAMSISKYYDASGITLRTPNGSRYRIYISNDGTLHTELIK